MGDLGSHHSKHSVLGIFPEGMDAFSIFFFLVIIGSASYQIIYMISPARIRKVMEYYDYDPASAKHPFILFRVQMSQIIGLSFLIITGLFFLQSSVVEGRKNEASSTADTQYFYQQIWSTQSYQYQCLIISVIWFGIKILMGHSRRERMALEEIAKIEAAAKSKAASGKESVPQVIGSPVKGSQAKKND